MIVNFLDNSLVTPITDKIIQQPAKAETINLELQIAAAAMGSQGAAPAYGPNQLGVDMAGNGMVSRHISLQTSAAEEVKAIAACATKEHLTQIAMDQQSSTAGKWATWGVSQVMLPKEPACICSHADVRKGLVYKPILKVHGVGGSVRENLLLPASPADHDLQGATFRGKNL